MNGGAFSGWQITLTISKISLCMVYTAIAVAVIAAIAIWRSRERRQIHESRKDTSGACR